MLEKQKITHTHNEEGPNKENSVNEMGGYNRENFKNTSRA